MSELAGDVARAGERGHDSAVAAVGALAPVVGGRRAARAGTAGTVAASLLRNAAGRRPAGRRGRAGALLDDAHRTAPTTGEQFCEAEILRMRAGIMRRNRQVELAGRDYEEAVAVARHQGARMLELRALTDWLRLPGAPGSRPRRPRDLRRRHS